MAPTPQQLSRATAQPANPDTGAVPRHIAIIMDGNGRWANQRGLPRIKGHEEGANALRAACEGCIENGVEILTVYAFSSENWKRPRAEVAALMHLLERFLREKLSELMENGIRLDAIGRTGELPASCQRELDRVIQTTAPNTRLTLVFALSYSSRIEIIDAVQRIAREARAGQLDPDAITADLFARHLYTHRYPDPDLLIRTSGEMRLSNFLLWQLSYTELYVTPTLWPDFRKPDLLDAIREYGKRQRRYGGL